MAISETSFKGNLTKAITDYITANPGCNARTVSIAVGTTLKSAEVIICRIRERVWFTNRTILTYQKPDGLRFKKESE